MRGAIVESVLDEMLSTVRLRPTRVESGPGIEGRVFPDTGSQISAVSRGMSTILQANSPLTAPVTQRTFCVVLTDQVIAQAVGTTEPPNVTVTGGVVAGPVQLSRIVLIIHKGDDGLLLLGHPTMVSQLGIDVENILANLPANVAEFDIRCTIASLAAARGAYSDPDPSTALLTDQAPPLVSAPDEEMQKRVRLMPKGVDKAAKGGMDTEAWADLSSVLTDFTRRFRAGRRVDDPPADVPATKVQLRPDTRPVQARVQRSGHIKSRPTLTCTYLRRCWDGDSGFGIAVCKPGNGGREVIIGKLKVKLAVRALGTWIVRYRPRIPAYGKQPLPETPLPLDLPVSQPTINRSSTVW